MNSTVKRPRRSRSWLILAAIPAVILVLWLVGVGVFRQSAANTAAIVSISAPPPRLETASDFLALGDYEFDQGNTDNAITAYTRAIGLAPNFAEAYNNRAYTYMVLEDYASALPDLDKAIALRPDYVNALMNRGDIHNYYYAIDFDLAVDDYDHILQAEADAPSHTSVCGHRLLALNHGWGLGVLMELLTRGAASGCPDRPQSRLELSPTSML